MEHVLDRFALAASRARGKRSFEFLGPNDTDRLKAFFLSFDFDQRREYFGGGMSAHAILEHCGAIDWAETTIIARSGSYCLEAIASVTQLPSTGGSAELSVACPLRCDRRPIIGELLDLVMAAASVNRQRLVVERALAMPELLALLRANTSASFDGDIVRIDVPTGCMRTISG